jgi:hypothetical protein
MDQRRTVASLEQEMNSEELNTANPLTQSSCPDEVRIMLCKSSETLV